MNGSPEGWECAAGCPVRLLGEQSGTLKSNSGTAFKRNADKDRNSYGTFNGKDAEGYYGDSGTAARFFKTFSEEESLNLFTRTDTRAEVLEGDCLDRLREMEDESVEAVVTDPPAGISFMNAEWDSNKGSRNQWIAWLTEVMEETLRVTKPGGHALVWALPRTSHWTAMALEDAGWEVRDRVTHHFGSGFPKSANVSKQIDKMAGRIGHNTLKLKGELRSRFEESGLTLKQLNAACGFEASGYLRTSSTWAGVLPERAKWEVMHDVLGCGSELDEVFTAAEREVIDSDTKARSESGKSALPTMGAKTKYETWDITAPATDAAKQWDGWGTALKPSTEDWWLCRKPLSESSIARQVLSTGTGAINVDGCRVSSNGDKLGRNNPSGSYQNERTWNVSKTPGGLIPEPTGRFPANLLLSHSESCVRIGEKRVKGDSPKKRNRKTPKFQGLYNGGKPGVDANNKPSPDGYADPDGKETVAAYECAEGCPVDELGKQSGELRTGGVGGNTEGRGGYMKGWKERKPGLANDSGTAARFFQQFTPDTGAGFRYVAKAAKRERNLGLADFLPRTKDPHKRYRQDVTGSFKARAKNRHSTVKPVELLRYLSRLICPPGGTILDPFCGSGTGGVAAIKEGFNFIGIEMEMPSVVTARARIEHALYEAQPKEETPEEGLFSLEEVCNA